MSTDYLSRQATLFDAIAHGDAEHRAWLDACTHEWRPYHNEHGDPGQICDKCNGFVEDEDVPVAPALTSEQGEKLATVGKYRKRSPIVTAWRWQGQPESEWPTWLNGLEPMLRNGLDYGWGFVDQSPYRARTVTPSDFEREFEPLSEAGDLVGKVIRQCIGTMSETVRRLERLGKEHNELDGCIAQAEAALDALSPSEGMGSYGSPSDRSPQRANSKESE